MTAAQELAPGTPMPVEQQAEPTVPPSASSGSAVLRGPADADHYRQKVGRYGDRWYTDPLASCPIAEASDWQGPSWSIVKGAAGKDWSFVANKRNANADQAELERIAKLEPTDRAKAFNAINSSGLSQAAGRGTIVHLWAEDLLAGRSPREITAVDLMAMRLPKAALAEALTYRASLAAFFDTYQPELVAAEYVAIHRSLNGVGYGCTPDVVARIEGDLLGLDWKARGIDSDHGAYPEEAAQIAAGARAEYMIVTDADGNPQRALLPEIAGGLVVSIKPDGCRAYPVDLDKAFHHTVAMHSFWCARRDEKASIGRPWAPRKSAAPASPAVELRAGEVGGALDPDAPSRADPDTELVKLDLRTRIAALIDAGHTDDMVAAWPPVPTLAAPDHQHTANELQQIERAVVKVEAKHQMPFAIELTPEAPTTPVAAPTDTTAPDDGATIDASTAAALRRRMEALPSARMSRLAELATEAHEAGCSISVQQKSCVRRFEIARALVQWAECGGTDDDLYAAVGLLLDDDQAADPDQAFGALLGRLTIDQAQRLADTFDVTVAA